MLSVCGLALAALACAQAPADTPVIADAKSAPALSAPGAAAATMAAHDHAGGACCEATKTTCVSQPATKTTKKVEFSSVCEKFCVQGCRGLPFFGSCDNNCGEENCGHAYTKRYLVKKVHTEVCETTKCVPVTVPACTAGRCCTSGHATTEGAPPPMERVPAPLPKGAKY